MLIRYTPGDRLRMVPLVAADERPGILGFGYYTQFRDRSAYRYCVEDSVYAWKTSAARASARPLCRT